MTNVATQNLSNDEASILHIFTLGWPEWKRIMCLSRRRDKTMKAEGVIRLDITDKDAPASKRPKGIGARIDPPPSMFCITTAGSSQETTVTASLPMNLLTIAQMAQAHES
ncbi:hypothetical protein HAX54_008311 [Datura stramonium]|uniref:Uncharacterized protein n=1 Tax=Datura stramonium TaxID=4076 RepID=A0ABS8TE05_DATST|nr:hypothetical protein [Datura stramonium]